MKSILDIRLREGDPYFKYNSINKILDKLKTKTYIPKKLGLLDKEITRVSIPPNYNKDAYSYNILRAIGRATWSSVSVRGNRLYDLDYLDSFQKNVLSFCIVRSMSIILINNKKTVKNSVIAIEDGGNTNNLSLIEECAKYTKRIVLVTRNFKNVNNIRSHILLNYGVSPEFTTNINDTKGIDFIISDKAKSYGDIGVWYLDSFYEPEQFGNLVVNDVLLSINDYEERVSPELLGALLKSDINISKRVEDFFDSNKINIEEIRFGKKEIDINSY